MQSPSNSQMKAIKHGKGPMLVLAGPGSGKTFVMIQRVLNLIHEQQIRPEHILVISFSKASTLELKQRFQKQSKEKIRLEESLSKQFKEKNRVIQSLSKDTNYCSNSKSNLLHAVASEVNFATFHACFFHILKETYRYT